MFKGYRQESKPQLLCGLSNRTILKGTRQGKCRKLNRDIDLAQTRLSKHGNTYLHLPDLILKHDIELNPGPTKIKSICGSCEKLIRKNQESIKCDEFEV